MAEADTFDIIIVGGGTAGLVLASRLSEDATLQALVLEAGLDLPQLPEKLMQAVLTPAANAQLYKTPVDWNFKTVPQVRPSPSSMVKCTPGSTLTLRAHAPKANLGGRELCFPQGKMLGGSSGLNGLSFTANAKAVVEGWAELGNPGWEWPAFSQSLSKTYTVSKAPPVVARQSSSSSSNEGPLQLSYADDYRGGWPKAWAETIESLGFPGAQDALAGQAGAGGLMIPDTVDPAAGIRSYAASAYLPPEVRGRANLTVRTGVEVKKVLFEKKAPGGSSSGDDAGGGLDAVVATGVEYYHTDPTTATGATETTATARREVIVAAGAFGSPRLLELSGIGDARRLSRGAATDDAVVVIDLPGVGENLQNHPLATVSLEVTDDAPPTKDAFLRAAIRQDDADKVLLGGAVQEYAEHRTGLLASSGVTSAAQLPLPGLDTPAGARDLKDVLLPLLNGQTTGAGGGGGGGGAFSEAHERFVRGILSSPRDEASSGYYILGPAYAAFNPDGTGALPPLDGSEDSYVTIVLLLAHPLSRGSVHVVGAGAGAAGQTTLAIDPGFLSHPLDLEIMARHLRFIEEGLAATEPLAKWVKPNGKRAVGAPEAGALKDLEVAKK